MRESPVITIIIPMHRPSDSLAQIRASLATAQVPIQIIIVWNHPTQDPSVTSQASYETVMISSRQGRGYAFLTGVSQAKGEIVLLLHADTIPPKRWDQAILKALEDPQVVGGGFSLRYDASKWYLRYGTRFIDLVFRFTGELYGDRGMFLRITTLKQCLNALDVPLFEDVRLSKCMRSKGKIVMLKEKMVTSAREFLRYGMLSNLRRYVTCRLWYALGGSPERLFQFYYKRR